MTSISYWAKADRGREEEERERSALERNRRRDATMSKRGELTRKLLVEDIVSGSQSNPASGLEHRSKEVEERLRKGGKESASLVFTENFSIEALF